MDTQQLIAALPDMAVFALVIEQGSFSATARKLGVSPSAISRQMTRLEKTLQVKLLERNTRTVKPSEAGKLTYLFCQQILNAARDVSHAAQTDTEPTGELRIAAPKAYARQVLEPLLVPFLQQYPHIRLRFKVSDYAIHPIQEDVDVVFRPTDKPLEGFVAKTIGQVESILCASPDYLANHGTPQHPHDLTQHACIDLGETPQDREWTFYRPQQTLRVRVTGRYSVNHSEMRLSGIKHGLGIGLLPDFTARASLKDGSLVHVLSDWKLGGNYQGAMVMQFAASRFMPAQVRAFIDYITHWAEKQT